MYVIDRRIEELESQLIKLNSLRDDIESRIAELEAFVEKAMANPMIAGMLG